MGDLRNRKLYIDITLTHNSDSNKGYFGSNNNWLYCDVL